MTESKESENRSKSSRTQPSTIHRPVQVKPTRVVKAMDADQRRQTSRPLVPPEGYIEGPHKVVPSMPKRPTENVVYVNRGGEVQSPGLVDELPEGVDPNTVTIEQMRGYAQNKRLMLYKKIPVKFNEASLIDWTKFSKEFKARMYGEITSKYYAMLNQNKDLLVDLAPYTRQFNSIEELYKQYIDVKKVVDTRWLRNVIKAGIILFYTGIGYVLDNWYDLSTNAAISMIIQTGISDELINRLDISPDMTNRVVQGGGIPVILKLIGLVIFNIILVYVVCRFIESSTVHDVIGKVSGTANKVATTGTIDMQQVMTAGGPFVSLIMSRMTSPTPSTPNPTITTSATAPDDDYDIEEED